MRRKHMVFLVWSIAAGLLVSFALAASMYYFNTAQVLTRFPL